MEGVVMIYHILIVEDDLVIQSTMRTFLMNEGYQVTVAKDGEEALSLFELDKFHLILLDMLLPKKGGEEVLNCIRQQAPLQPVVIISALDDEFIQLNSYIKKIEDYIVKPFSMNILLFKIATLLKRIYDNELEMISIKNITLHVNQYEVYVDGQPVELTPREFEILQTMFLKPGKVYSREELLTLVWGYGYLGESRTIDVHIKNIRNKINPDVIKTVIGVGYKVEKVL